MSIAGAKVMLLFGIAKDFVNYFLFYFTQGVPIAQIGLFFYLFLDVVGQLREEVEPGKALYLINAADVTAHVARGALVLVEEAEGMAVVALFAEHDLEKGFGHDDAVAPDGAVLAVVEHGAADDVEAVIALCPGAALQLDIVPRASIESVMLGTDVGEEERLLLCLAVPLVVARRTHVTAVKARAAVVGVVGARAADVGVLVEHLGRAVIAP